MVFEYVSSAKEKEEKEAKAKLKKEQEKREMAQAWEASFDRQNIKLGTRRLDSPDRRAFHVVYIDRRDFE